MHDVIVAGAGPAGNIAARRLSEMGHKVAVLDWRENLGDKLCTGIVGRECVERFPPDREDIFRQAHSATVVAPSGKIHRIEKGEPQAYIVDREAYVASMARRALEAGASYSLGERVTEIERTPAGVALRTASKAGPRAYKARALVVASGFSSPLLRMVGLGGGGHNGYNCMVAYQAEVVSDHLEETEVYLGDGIAPGSFGWLVPLSGSRALLGIVSSRKLNGHMKSFLSALGDKGKVSSIVKGPDRWGIPLKPLSRTYGDRVVVVGDAAGLVKPTSGGGIYYALLSGELAAETLHEAFVADDLSANSLKRYEARWKAVFGRELSIGYCARRLYEALGDHQIERLLNSFLAANIQREFLSSSELSFDWHSRLILKAVRHRELGGVIGSFGPVVAPFLLRLSGSRSA